MKFECNSGRLSIQSVVSTVKKGTWHVQTTEVMERKICSLFLFHTTYCGATAVDHRLPQPIQVENQIIVITSEDSDGSEDKLFGDISEYLSIGSSGVRCTAANGIYSVYTTQNESEEICSIRIDFL